MDMNGNRKPEANDLVVVLARYAAYEGLIGIVQDLAPYDGSERVWVCFGVDEPAQDPTADRLVADYAAEDLCIVGTLSSPIDWRAFPAVGSAVS